MSRRAPVGFVVACSLAIAFTAAPSAAARTPRSAAPAPPSTKTPIQHFVTLMQENHSFDNYFGTYPGADGIPPQTCVPVDPAAAQPCAKPFVLGGRPLVDLAHGRGAFVRSVNGGAMNGFVAAQSSQGFTNDLAMGHYGRSDLRYYWNLADRFVLFDRFFSAAAGGTVWNHLFWVTGTPGNPAADAIPPQGFGAVPTIFDRLEEKGVSWKFYVQNYDATATFRQGAGSARRAQVTRVPLLAYARYVDDPKLFSHIVPLSEYYDDLRRGTLPAVSYIVPSGSSERPPGNIGSGARLVRSLVDSLAQSNAWASSAFVWTYDNSGGWYDHVPPPQVDAFGYGFRVPALLVSAYAREGHVDHTQLDTTSVLRFIEDNWSLAPLSTRDASAGSLGPAFDFARAARPATIIPAGAPVPTFTPARTWVVLLLYGVALVGTVGLIAAIAWRMRRRREAALS